MTKILIVEDNVPNLDMLARRLEKRGYQVIAATNGEQGVKRARTDLPNLILMDLSLPGIDGWEATKILKSHASTFKTPIIALTAHAMMGDRDRAIEAGCSDYDTKPVDISRLLGKIEQSLLASRMNNPEER